MYLIDSAGHVVSMKMSDLTNKNGKGEAMSDYVMFCPREGRESILDFYDPTLKRGSMSGYTVEQLAAQYGAPVTIVLYEEAVAHDRRRIVSEPVEVSEWTYFHMLEVMPPARWMRVLDAEIFYVPEPIYADVVSWYISLGGKFYVMKDSCTLPIEGLKAAIQKVPR